MAAQSKSTIQESKSPQDKDNHAIAYLRVSTERQQEKGHSIEVQEQYAKDYAAKHGLEIVGFIRESKSASKAFSTDLDISSNLAEGLKNRPKLQEIINLAGQKKFKHLIVTTRDRLARNLELFVALNFFLQNKGIKIHYSKPGETMKSENASMNRFLELVLGSVAELEANLISVRVKAGVAQCVKGKNWAGGHPPYGYLLKKRNSKNSTLQKSFTEAKYVKEIFQLYNQSGYSYRKIAQLLNERENTDLWTKGKIESILRNETYSGEIVWGRTSRRSFNKNSDSIVKSGPIKEIQIIDPLHWDDSVKLRYKKSEFKDPKYYSTPFLLRDKLICATCKEYFETKNYGYYKNGTKREDVYRCSCMPESPSKSKRRILKKNAFEESFMKEVFQSLKIDADNSLWSYYNERAEDITSQALLDLDSIERELKSKHVLHDHLGKLIAIESIEPVKESMIAEQAKLEKEIKILDEYRQELERLSQRYLENPKRLEEEIEIFFHKDFPSLPVEKKRLIIDKLVEKVVVYPDNSIKIFLNAPIDII